MGIIIILNELMIVLSKSWIVMSNIQILTAVIHINSLSGFLNNFKQAWEKKKKKLRTSGPGSECK